MRIKAALELEVCLRKWGTSDLLLLLLLAHFSTACKEAHLLMQCWKLKCKRETRKEGIVLPT